MKNLKGKVAVFMFTFLLILFPDHAIFAQNIVKGVVKEKSSGEPLPFVSIQVKGTTIGTSTVDNGTYSISANPDAILIFSSIGYKTIEVPVQGKAVVDIEIESDNVLLDEVVMVAYGTQKKQNVISSVSSLKGEDLTKTPVASMNHAMQGKMTGVQISSASGTPGGAVTVRIRGASSLTAGNDPLYVIDGIPVTSTDYSQMAFGGQTTNPIASINPSDIENIQVLKDAAASALYGSRASNGVILITTKRGRSQKTKVTFDAYYGVQNLWKELNFLGTTQWLAAQNEARDNYNKQWGYASADKQFISPIKAEVEGVDTPWLKEVTRSSPMLSNIQATASGGNEKTQFYMSAGWFKQEGLQKKSDYDRYSFRAKINHQFNKRVKLDLNASFTTSDNNRLFGDNNIYGPMFNAARNRPDQPIYDSKSPTGYYRTIRNNPVGCYQELTALNRNQRLMGDVKFEWNIWDNLVFRSNMGADFSYIHEMSKFTSKSPQSQLYGDEARDYSTYLNNYIIENTLSYNKDFGKLNFNVLLGQSFQQNQITRSYVAANGFVSDDLVWLESASKNTGFSSSFREFLMESYFGRISMGYDNRYLIEGTVRSDASSKFAKDKRVGVFPSGSLGWRVSNESFFPKNNVLTDVKIRGSVGLTGNQEGIDYYSYLTLYSAGMNYDSVGGVFPAATAPNPDLTWEKTLQTDIGIDLGFLNNRIEFTYDYFMKNTKDLLLSRPYAITTGWGSIMQNVGKVKTTGHELSIFSRNIVKKNFQWNTSFNISFIDNKVTELGKNSKGEYEGFNTGSRSRIEVGYPVSSFYVIKATGIYQNDGDVPKKLYDAGVRAGDVIYEDFNKDGIITAADKQMYKSGSPKAYGGLTNSFSFYGFDAEVNLQFSLGNWMYTYWKETDGAANGGRSNYGIMEEHYTNRWTPSNKHNDPMYPRFVYGTTLAGGYNTQSGTSRWLQDASYLRIKSLSLGYTLPTHLTQKIHIERLRVYLNVENLYTFTKYDGYDPEVEYSPTSVAERSVDFLTVPQLRSITFGINLSF